MLTTILQPLLVTPLTAIFGDSDVTSVPLASFSNGFNNGFVIETFDE